jgi:Zn-dependent membrane protease YugP
MLYKIPGGYAFFRFRHALVSVANIGSNFTWILIMVGIFAYLSGMILLGIVCKAAAVLFQIVTLPAEFNASIKLSTWD